MPIDLCHSCNREMLRDYNNLHYIYLPVHIWLLDSYVQKTQLQYFNTLLQFRRSFHTDFNA